MLLRILCFCLGGLSLMAQAEQQAVPYVVGGQDASQNYPWMAQVFVGDHRCGGVLIGSSWVLTAAHCTYDETSESKHLPVAQVSVVLGVYSMVGPDDSRALAVSEIYQHPNYVEPGQAGIDYDYDISLLRLATPQEIAPPILNANGVSSAVNYGAFMRLIGFGRTNNDPLNPEYPPVLQQANLSLYQPELCANAWSSDKLSEQMFCAFGTDADACSGDSGGPVFISEGDGYRLLGLVSWGNLSCQGSPGVYADVGSMCTWISDTASLAGDSSLQCSEASPSSSSGGASFYLLLLAFPLLLHRRLQHRV
ncbi:S1 family peptidase [Agarivorans gilvus]|uniref:Serine protease n=2 Tax=Agarivorans gilvus TaxID=680279 RepID=A0ABQ1HZ78_9ALTE|nr:serine protease [Agarivorans gilvus]GGB01120.1 serine protease [Agarivorans gilvus]